MLFFETASGIAIGSVFGAWITHDVPGWVAIVVGIVWILFFILRISAQFHFPTVIVDDLIAQAKLKSANDELVRRNIVLGFLSESVMTLNGETCNLENADSDSICSMSLEDGLRTVLAPLVDRPHQILGCIESKFSILVGVLDYSYGNPDQEDPPNRFVCLRDDFELSSQIDDQLMQDHRAQGFRLDSQEGIRRAFNENHMHLAQAKLAESTVALLVAPLPIVCDPRNADGVIIIFYKLRSSLSFGLRKHSQNIWTNRIKLEMALRCMQK
jgi:hypothetical protein